MAAKKSGTKAPVIRKTLKAFPQLLKQWHPTKNGDIDPHKLIAGTHAKAWWKCPRGSDHEWQAEIKSRALYGSGCPLCRGLQLSVTNRLDIVAPFLLAEWDYEKNGDLTPDKVTYGTSLHIWWRCPKGPDHVWQNTARDRLSRDGGCPFCSRKRVSVTNSLATLKPELAKQWHPTKNGDLTPADVVPGSKKRVWWQCPKRVEHIWEISVGERSSGRGCPYCGCHSVSTTNSLLTLNPALAREWHATKNGELTPADVMSHSHTRVWWQCSKFAEHEWDTAVYNRAAGQGCPYCASRPQRVCGTNSLAGLVPHLVAEWHPTKNGTIRPTDITSRASFAAWWKCPKGPDHEWQSPVYNRTGKSNSGCPFCAGRRTSLTNSVAFLYPNVAAQWHPTKNGDLTPDQVVPGCNRRVYWRCVMGHEWLAIIYSRTKAGSGCPHCRRRKQKVVTKRKRQETVYMPSYEGPRATPMRRPKKG